MSKQETLHNPHDTFFKKLMSDPQNVRDFISGFLPSEIANNIDLDTIKHKDREQLTKKNRRLHLDLAITCKLSGKDAEIYIIFEHKSMLDKLTLVQILTYCAALWEHNILNEKRPPVPVIPVVFYHGKDKFDLPNRFGNYFAVDESLKGYMVDFGYALFNTADFAEDEIAQKSYNNLYLGASLMALKRIFDSLPEMEITLRHILQLDATKRLRIFEYLVTSKDVKSEELYHAPFDVRYIETKDAVADDYIDTVVQPDIVVVCDPKKLDDRGCIGSPDLIIEILSPSTSRMDMTVKFELYQHFGVKEYWIVHPKDQTVLVFKHLESGLYGVPERYCAEDAISVALLGDLVIDLMRVFS